MNHKPGAEAAIENGMPSAAETRSADIIERYQDASGAYIASPNFPTYASCWLRDGSFIAYAMIRAGRPAGALGFLEWTARAILRHAGRLDTLRENLASGRGVGSAFLPTRYTLDGNALEDDWPNFQIDGYGTWLWCLDEYLSATGDTTLLNRMRPAIDL
ncbi:MAG: glycoside hydrolase family 15 protein, partial [Spirochaetota bacterium]